MELQRESLDHILFDLYEHLLKRGSRHHGSRGDTFELLGVALRIARPRARISRSENRGKPFSALGELLWYLSGSDRLEFIKDYVSEYEKDAVDGVLEGAYGPRLLAMRGEIDQFASIEKLLTEKPGSRRAVIQLFNAEDITTEHKEIPCTTTLQFHCRNGQLHLSVTLRSNDAYWGLPHDVFCFTMLQEMMARRLQVEVGEYYQYVGSMHIYEKHVPLVKEYLAEGVQQVIEMPPMPQGNPFEMVGQLLRIEARLRAGEEIDADRETPDDYWSDIVRLLQVFWLKQADGDNSPRLRVLRAQMKSPSYHSYVDGRIYLETRANDKCAAGKDDEKRA
jgi:thymidylate synthase